MPCKNGGGREQHVKPFNEVKPIWDYIPVCGKFIRALRSHLISLQVESTDWTSDDESASSDDDDAYDSPRWSPQ